LNRSTTRGLRSIIARWSWYISNTLFLVMPDGRGVIVVKTAVFGILYLSCIGSFPNWCFKKLLVDEGDQCLRAREAGEVERRCLDSKAARTDVLVSQAMDPAKSADMRRTRISRVLERDFTHPCIQNRSLGTTIPRQAPANIRERCHCFSYHALENILPATPTLRGRMLFGRFVLWGHTSGTASSYWRRRERCSPESR
jgi:hypothetical protein